MVAGGNTFRSWDTEHLNQSSALAAEQEILVAFGLETGPELQNF